MTGHVYLIHFREPYKHARHYLGWTSQMGRRMRHHRTGSGSRLMAAVSAAGLEWKVVRTWWGDRAMERRMHVRANSRGWCPVCRGAVTFEDVQQPKAFKGGKAWLPRAARRFYRLLTIRRHDARDGRGRFAREQTEA